jgi:hypothetical protein
MQAASQTREKKWQKGHNSYRRSGSNHIYMQAVTIANLHNQ